MHLAVQNSTILKVEAMLNSNQEYPVGVYHYYICTELVFSS